MQPNQVIMFKQILTMLYRRRDCILLFLFCTAFSFLSAGCNEPAERPPTKHRASFPPRAEIERLITSTRDTALSTYAEAGFIFKYGTDCSNIFNSFVGTYTMLADTGKSPSVRLALTSDEVDSIIKVMRNVGFFDFPDTFSYSSGGRISYTAGSGFGVYFGVRYPEAGALQQKELWWIDHNYTGLDSVDDNAVQLRWLIQYIRAKLENKPAVKNMSRPFRFLRID